MSQNKEHNNNTTKEKKQETSFFFLLHQYTNCNRRSKKMSSIKSLTLMDLKIEIPAIIFFFF
jgi:hypothetical protein